MNRVLFDSQILLKLRTLLLGVILGFRQNDVGCCVRTKVPCFL